jgi:hypothetical protein
MYTTIPQFGVIWLKVSQFPNEQYSNLDEVDVEDKVLPDVFCIYTVGRETVIYMVF